MDCIAFKNSLLARLFGGEPEPGQEAPEEEAQTPSPPPPPKPPRGILQLPPEHAMQRLWSRYCEEARWIPAPLLQLADPKGLCEKMTDAELQKELLRLQLAVNAASNERANRLVPPKKNPSSRRPESGKAEEEDPPPPDLDAQAVVYVSENQLLAWLFLFPPVGKGQELDRRDLDRILDSQQVRYGVDWSQIDRIPKEDHRYFRLFPIAAGDPAVPGIDGRVVDLFPRVVERKITVDEHNRVDYMSLSTVQNVEADSVICRIIPPSMGVPGRTVRDEPISTRDGRPASAPKGRNTYLSEDGTKLLASISGDVEFSGRSFQVKPLLEISGNVDYSTGNINFLGDVCIHGDVCTGFTVRAMGNITVDGVVEACSVEAGGDLVVARGIQGDDRAVIRAQRDLYAKYLENCCIYVKNNLHTDCVINCDVYCDGGVDVRSGRMTVIGGRIKAAHEISAGTIGSRTETRTELFLGGYPCDDFDYDILRQESDQLEASMKALELQPDSPDKFSRISKTKMKLMLDRGKLELLDKERALRQAEPEDPGVRRLVCDHVYPGTVLTIGEASYSFTRVISPCSATLLEGEIMLI